MFSLNRPGFQVVGDGAVRAGHEGGVLHLADLFAHGHLRNQVQGAGFGVLAPVLVNVQFAVGVEVFEFQAVHGNDVLDVGDNRLGLCGRLLGKRRRGKRQDEHQGDQQA